MQCTATLSRTLLKADRYPRVYELRTYTSIFGMLALCANLFLSGDICATPGARKNIFLSFYLGMYDSSVIIFLRGNPLWIFLRSSRNVRLDLSSVFVGYWRILAPIAPVPTARNTLSLWILFRIHRNFYKALSSILSSLTDWHSSSIPPEMSP